MSRVPFSVRLALRGGGGKQDFPEHIVELSSGPDPATETAGDYEVQVVLGNIYVRVSVLADRQGNVDDTVVKSKGADPVEEADSNVTRVNGGPVRDRASCIMGSGTIGGALGSLGSGNSVWGGHDLGFVGHIGPLGISRAVQADGTTLCTDHDTGRTWTFGGHDLPPNGEAT